MKDADHLIDLEPENHEGYARRAEVNNALAKYSDAERDALEAVKRDPADVAAWKALARARLAQGKAAQAKDAATLALEIDPNDAEAYLLRADAEDVLGDHEAARRDRAKAAELELQAKPKLLEQSETGSNAFGERPSYSFPFGAGAPDGRVPWAAAGLAGFSALSAALGFAYWKNRSKRGPVGSIDLSKPT